MKNIPLLLALTLVFVLCNLTSRFQKSLNSNSNSVNSTAPPEAGGAVERPSPTSAQKAAIANGQTASWDQAGISWTVPANWHKDTSDSKSFSESGGNTAFLIGSISAMDASFPVDISIKAMYDQAQSRMKLGQVDEVRWLELDGVKGVEFREAKPEHPDDIRRLQWQAYRKYNGQTQLVNLILSARGAAFDKNQDAFYGILYSTKVAH